MYQVMYGERKGNYNKHSFVRNAEKIGWVRRLRRINWYQTKQVKRAFN